jgi:hypothetical protein
VFWTLLGALALGVAWLAEMLHAVRYGGLESDISGVLKSTSTHTPRYSASLVTLHCTDFPISPRTVNGCMGQLGIMEKFSVTMHDTMIVGNHRDLLASQTTTD